MTRIALRDISPDTISESELVVYRLLRPYIGRCLGLNHEVNNALAGVIGYAEFLSDGLGELSEEQRNCVSRILTSAERIEGIIDDLCRLKMRLSEEIDMQSVTEAFKKLEPSD